MNEPKVATEINETDKQKMLLGIIMGRNHGLSWW